MAAGRVAGNPDRNPYLPRLTLCLNMIVRRCLPAPPQSSKLRTLAEVHFRINEAKIIEKRGKYFLETIFTFNSAQGQIPTTIKS